MPVENGSRVVRVSFHRGDGVRARIDRSVATLVLVSAHSMERTTGGAQSRPGEEEFQHSDYFLMVRLDYNIDFQQMGKSQEEQKR